MPANLTPQYHAAEENFKKAVTSEEKIAALEEMLAVIPKHKGTEKLQADIKKRLSRLKEDSLKKSGSKRFDPFSIEKQGAGQVALFGFPNTGKSLLLNNLTRACVKVAPYPFTTLLPATGMMPYEDIMVQMVDLPPVTDEIAPAGIAGALINADIVLVVFDASSDDCLDQVNGCISFLYRKKVLREENSPGVRRLPPHRVLLVGNKSELPDSKENTGIIKELGPSGFRLFSISALTGMNIEDFKTEIFKTLNIIRVYSKMPGKEPDMKAPFVLRSGSTVMDLAEKIHKDLASNLKSARVWGSTRYDGQLVQRDYAIRDKDIVEINA